MKNRYTLFFALIACSTSLYAQDPGAAAGATGTVTGTYKGATITYTTVRAKDGWVWLQQNVGSASVATSATDGAGYGDLFQWGRWDDGHQSRSPENVIDGMPTPNNPAGLNLSGGNPFYKGGGITWYNEGTVNDTWTAATPAAATATNGCDPCKQIFGDGWQMPSLNDWQHVRTLEGISNVTTGFGSNLKMTAAGARNELLGTLGDEGVASIYWSSTAEAGSAPQAMYINLGTGNFADYNYRGIGMSVRCLKKSPPTSIKENKTGGSFRLYPNPAKDYVVVTPAQAVTKYTVAIRDIAGRMVYQGNGQSNSPVTISLQGLLDGIYTLVFDAGEQAQTTKLFVSH